MTLDALYLFSIKYILIPAAFLIAVGSAGHALLYKRNPSSALGWIAVSLIYPFVGPLLYFLFGINRVRTRAKKLERRSPFRIRIGYEILDNEESPFPAKIPLPVPCQIIGRISDAVTN